MEDGKVTVKKTACSICGPCCPIDAYVKDGKIISVEGSKSHPGQKGCLCSKGAASKQYVYNKERILYPMKRIGPKNQGAFARISWDEAYEMIAEKLLKIRGQYGAQSVLFYVGYPKWFRPALLRLSNGFGSPNFCTESSTCFQAAALAWRLLYGNGICGPDLAHTNTVLIWSSNLYHSNVTMGSTYRDLKERGVKIIVVDPRKTVTAHEADLHLQLIPGTDGALALGMANIMIQEGLYDRAFVEQYVHGFEEYQAYVQEFTLEKVEKITGVKACLIEEASKLYAQHGPASLMFSAAPVVHNINGVQNYRAVFSLIALTGNYDIEGGNRVQATPVAPQNGVRKVQRLHTIQAIGEQEFPVWFDLSCEEAQCSRMADYIKEEGYPVKAVVGFGLNHHMWPEPDYLLDALSELDFYVNTEIFFSDSCKVADLILPACTSFEREEVKAERGGRFYLAEKAIEPLGESKSDLEIIMGIANKLGIQDDVLQLGVEQYQDYVLEPAGLTIAQLRKNKNGLFAKHMIEPKLKTYEQQNFATPTGKIEFYSLVLDKYRNTHGYHPLPFYQDYRECTNIDRTRFPLILNTGSRKPQLFHARVYRMPWLANLETLNLVDLHPKEGKAYGIQDGDKVRINTPIGSIEGIACWNTTGLSGVIHMYHGNPKADVNNVLDRTYLDPISGFPGYKSYFCNIEKVQEDEKE
ncbi:molybdopterin-containing oxidoreductase family protein [Lachnospiraceae bacterium LCP25S3_G4]